MASHCQRNDSNIWWVHFQHNGTRVQKSSGKTRKSNALRYLSMVEENQRHELGYQKVRFDVLCQEFCPLTSRC